jgi:hypothetical protein
MIFNHPSAYIYTSPCPSHSSAPRSSHLLWTPEPHVGASEGPSWSPYLKSSQSISPRSDANLSRWDYVPVDGAAEGVVRTPSITLPCGCAWAALLEEGTEHDSTPPLTPSSVTSSTCSSFTDLDDHHTVVEERPAFETRKRRITLESMVQEPPCPIPTPAKTISP